MDRLSFREVEYPEPYGMPVHEHDIDCIVFVQHGTVRETRGREEFDAPGASLLFVPAGRPHANRYLGNVRTFDIVFTPDYSDEYREFLPRDVRPTAWEPGLSTWLASRMRHELEQRDTATPMILAGLTQELLGRMSRSTKASGVRPAWLRTVIDFIHGHPFESSSLSAIAATVRVHPAHLSRVFRKHYGCTIGEYSRRLRLERACAALLQQDRPLADIVLEAGFSDQSHFSRAFKAHTGLTPGQYRRTMSVSQVSYKAMQL